MSNFDTNSSASSSSSSSASSQKKSLSSTFATHSTSSLSAEKDDVPRNTQGGVLVNRAELKAAFDFFDIGKKGYITLQDLKKQLGVFYQNLSLREYKFLMNNKNQLTEADLYQLLCNNELTGFDPVGEAFKVYDPNDRGYMDEEVFRRILANLDYHSISNEDIKTLLETADIDNDGKVSLRDFRQMLHKKPSATTVSTSSSSSSSLSSSTFASFSLSTSSSSSSASSSSSTASFSSFSSPSSFYSSSSSFSSSSSSSSTTLPAVNSASKLHGRFASLSLKNNSSSSTTTSARVPTPPSSSSSLSSASYRSERRM